MLLVVLLVAVASAVVSEDVVTVDVTTRFVTRGAIGALRDVAEVAPEKLGSTGRLDPVEFYGFADRAVQTLFRSDLLTGISIRQPIGPATLCYDASLVIDQSPIGYWRQTTLTAYPGPTGVSIDLLPATWNGPRFGATLGRVEMRDPTGFVLSHLADGLTLALRWPRVYVGAEFGYIGLLDKYANNIRFSDSDIAELFDPSHYFAPPRALGVLRVDYNDFYRQDISAFGVTQIDLRSDGEPRSSWYGGLVGNGWIPGEASHTTFLIVGGTWPNVEVGIMGGTEVIVSFDTVAPTEVAMELTYASGHGANLSPFPALDSPLAGEVIASQYTALITALLSARIHLEPGFVVGAIDPELWAQLLVGTHSDEAAPALGPYYGTEIGLKVPYQPVADVRIDLLLGVHIGSVLASDRAFFSGVGVEIDL